MASYYAVFTSIAAFTVKIATPPPAAYSVSCSTPSFRGAQTCQEALSSASWLECTPPTTGCTPSVALTAGTTAVSANRVRLLSV